MHAKSGGCLVINVQRAKAVFAVSVYTCLESSFRGAYHATARWRKTGARCDRASRLAETGVARAAHALLRIFNFARGGLVACSVQRGLRNGPGIRLEGQVLSAEIGYARSRYLVQVRVDLDPSRAEYARRRSSTLDPGFSGTVRNNQEPSTLSGDLSIPISRKWFGISKSRVRSAEIFRSRYLGSGI